MENRLFLNKLNGFAGAVVLAGVIFTLRLVYVAFGPLDLSPDEAQYWNWSRHLDWGYYSKPPLVAWLNWLSTNLIGHTETAIRSMAIAGQACLTLTAFWVANRHYNKTAAWLAFATFTLTPQFAAGGLIMTTDIPCTVLWLIALAVLSTINWQSQAPQWGKFISIGLLVGFAGLAKYTAVLFYPLLGLYLLFYKNQRQWLRRPQVYVAGLISTICITPVLYWNYLQNFISFKHVFFHQVQGGGVTFNGWDSFSNFLLGQVAVVGPVTFFMLVAFWVLQRKTNKAADIMWWFSAPAFLFFVIKALDAKVQANWPVLAVATGLVGLCCWLSVQKRPWRWVFVVGLAFSAALSAMVHNTNLLRALGYPLPAKTDPLKPVLGWQPLGAEISEILKTIPAGTPIFTTRYQTASELSFYIQGQPKVHYVNPGWRRQNQYDLWPWPNLTNGIVYINEQNVLEKPIKEGFETCKKLPTAKGRVGSLTYHQAHLWHCQGHKGLQRLRPEHY